MDRRIVLKNVGWLSSRLSKHLDMMCAERNLSGVEGRTLHFLLTVDHDIFQKDIEFDSHLKPSTVSEILKHMEQKGLIRRESVPYDARLKKIVPTDKVSKLKKVLLSDMAQLDKELTEGISDEEIKIFEDISHRFIKNLDRMEGETE